MTRILTRKACSLHWAALFVLLGCDRNAQPEQRTIGSAEQKLVRVPSAPSAALPALTPPGAVTTPTVTSAAADPQTSLPAGTGLARFAVIGDYGQAGPGEAAVATLIHSWQPEFIITTGDNNYPAGEASTIDANIGQYFSDFIGRYRGGYGKGAQENRFFPSLGNHDWMAPGAKPYFDYFELPGNERYFDFVRGAVHFFSIDSDPHEPDGIDAASKQAAWLKRTLAKSTARWQIVYMHHPPYSSGSHGPTPSMQWPFKQWGVDLVLSGHDHTYERLLVAGLPYVVIGLGGRSIYPFVSSAPGSVLRYHDDLGALRVAANDQALICRFVTVSGEQVDQLQLP